MLAPPPLPRTLDAAIRDLGAARPGSRASAVIDLVRHALLHDEVRARALPLLEAALKGDAAAEVRSAAAVGLGDLHAGEALSALLVAIEDADPRVRQVAINALGEIGDARAVPRLARALADARPEVRYQAIIAYAKLATDAVDVDAALARALADEDDAVRYIALRVAEERRDALPDGGSLGASVLAAARACMEDASSHVALAAAILLAKAGDEPARAIILRVVREARAFGSAPEKEDEREAVELAGQLGLREAIPDLERRAWGLGGIVRDTCPWHAKIALARLGHARARAEILRDLASSRDDTRSAAVVAAGRARIEEARPVLERLRGQSSDPLVAEALAQLGG